MSLASARNVRPIGDAAARTIGWWGTVIGVIALAHLVAAANVAAVYLRSVSGTWPPGATEPPGIWIDLVGVGLALLATLACALAALVATRGRPLAAPLLLVAALLAAGGAAARGSTTVFSTYPATEHAYWSVRWFLGGLDLVLLGSTAVALAAGAVHALRGWIRPGAHAELASLTLWTGSVAGFALVTWLVSVGLTLWWGG